MAIDFRTREEEKSEEKLVQPEEWIPVFLATYRVLVEILSKDNVRPIAAGSVAYSLNVELTPTKDIDILLSKPLNPPRLADIGAELERALTRHGNRAVLRGVQLGSGEEDWVIQLFVIIPSGVEVGVEVFNLLVVRPASLFETTRRNLGGLDIETLTLESWFASKLADPRGINRINLKRLERAVKLVDKYKLLEIVMRVHLPHIMKENANNIINRTKSKELRELLELLQ